MRSLAKPAGIRLRQTGVSFSTSAKSMLCATARVGSSQPRRHYHMTENLHGSAWCWSALIIGVKDLQPVCCAAASTI